MNSAANDRVSIADFGAIADGTTLCTQAFADAIAALPETGGVVFVPPGTWLTATIVLRSGITLDLHPAATILGSGDLEDYPICTGTIENDRNPWHLIFADDLHDIAITGGGTIDGNGPAFWEPTVHDGDVLQARVAYESDPVIARLKWIQAIAKNRRPSPMIEITNCSGVRIDGVTITNSAGWNLHLHCSRFITLTRIRLDANLLGPNNDGFDISGCCDVHISDCTISCCDDAIVLKTTEDSQALERVTITNCVLRTPCVGVKLGARESFFDMRQITVSNCVMYETHRAVALYSLEGATYEDIVVSNIVHDSRLPYAYALPIQMECRRLRAESRLGRIRNVQISNVVSRTEGRIHLYAAEAGRISNVVLRDVRLTYPSVEDPSPAAAIEGGMLQFCPDDPSFRAARACLCAVGVQNLVVANLMIDWPEVDTDGRIMVPEGWAFSHKGRNGSWEIVERRTICQDRAIPFAVAWLRGVQGGLFDSPLAQPFGGAQAFDSKDSTITIRE